MQHDLEPLLDLAQVVPPRGVLDDRRAARAAGRARRRSRRPVRRTPSWCTARVTGPAPIEPTELAATSSSSRSRLSGHGRAVGGLVHFGNRSGERPPHTGRFAVGDRVPRWCPAGPTSRSFPGPDPAPTGAAHASAATRGRGPTAASAGESRQRGAERLAGSDRSSSSSASSSAISSATSATASAAGRAGSARPTIESQQRAAPHGSGRAETWRSRSTSRTPCRRRPATSRTRRDHRARSGRRSGHPGAVIGFDPTPGGGCVRFGFPCAAARAPVERWASDPERLADLPCRDRRRPGWISRSLTGSGSARCIHCRTAMNGTSTISARARRPLRRAAPSTRPRPARRRRHRTGRRGGRR